MHESMVRIAEEKFLNGDYLQALGIYKKLSSRLGEKFFRANIWLCEKKAIALGFSNLTLMPYDKVFVNEAPTIPNASSYENDSNDLIKKPICSVISSTAVDALLNLARTDCHEALSELAFSYIKGLKNPRQAARELLQVACYLGDSGEIEAEGILAKQALAIDSSEETMYRFFWSAERAMLITEALDVLVKLEAAFGSNPTATQVKQLERLRPSPIQQLRLLELLSPQLIGLPEPIPNRVAYVLHNSLPYSSGGYGTRSHGIALGLQAAGIDLVVLTRPGFPLDIKRELNSADVPLEDVIDGVRYIRTLEPSRIGRTTREYVIEAADELESQLRKLRPSSIVAASDYQNGLIAMIVARRLGVPFCYEVRGMWEITRMSRSPDFQNSPQFKVTQRLEAHVATNAEYVFTLTEPMLEDLVARGVDEERISLLPNSCDPDRFLPRLRNDTLAAKLGVPADVPVIGYIGTFVDYEGLEDLTTACAMLKARGHIFRLLLVGNENASGNERGPITQQIIEIAEVSGLLDWLVMPGRVPHDEVEAWYSLIDIAPFPRKPWPVCEMVSPMKPLEALAMEKAVVVSDVRALVEMIRIGETGVSFEKGNVQSLADVLQELLVAPSIRTKLGRAGREWVCTERTWLAVGRRFADRLGLVIAGESIH